MLTSWITLVLEISFWFMAIPQNFWAFTAPKTELWLKNEKNEIDPFKFDFVQAIVFSLFSMVVSTVFEWPVSLFYKFHLEESFGFNK